MVTVSQRMSTALVTGAAGFIGSHLVEGLVDRGYRVRGFDNLSEGDRSRLASVWNHDSFAFVEGDVRNAATVRNAMSDVDYVFHQAAFVSVPKSVAAPAHTTDINCTGTATVLEAAREMRVSRVVFASSAAVYGSNPPVPTPVDAALSPSSPYALSKRYGEQLATQTPIETVALRYFNVFGPRQDPTGEYSAVIPAFIDRMVEGERPVIYGDGEQTRDFVFVDDVVRANIRAAEASFPDAATPNSDVGRTYNVATGTRISITELVELLNDVLDTNLDPIYDEPRPGDVRHSGADITNARKQLAYEPTVSLRDGLAKTSASLS